MFFSGDVIKHSMHSMKERRIATKVLEEFYSKITLDSPLIDFLEVDQAIEFGSLTNTRFSKISKEKGGTTFLLHNRYKEPPQEMSAWKEMVYSEVHFMLEKIKKQNPDKHTSLCQKWNKLEIRTRKSLSKMVEGLKVADLMELVELSGNCRETQRTKMLIKTLPYLPLNERVDDYLSTSGIRWPGDYENTLIMNSIGFALANESGLTNKEQVLIYMAIAANSIFSYRNLKKERLRESFTHLFELSDKEGIRQHENLIQIAFYLLTKNAHKTLNWNVEELSFKDLFESFIHEAEAERLIDLKEKTFSKKALKEYQEQIENLSGSSTKDFDKKMKGIFEILSVKGVDAITALNDLLDTKKQRVFFEKNYVATKCLRPIVSAMEKEKFISEARKENELLQKLFDFWEMALSISMKKKYIGSPTEELFALTFFLCDVFKQIDTEKSLELYERMLGILKTSFVNHCMIDGEFLIESLVKFKDYKSFKKLMQSYDLGLIGALLLCSLMQTSFSRVGGISSVMIYFGNEFERICYYSGIKFNGDWHKALKNMLSFKEKIVHRQAPWEILEVYDARKMKVKSPVDLSIDDDLDAFILVLPDYLDKQSNLNKKAH